MDILYSVFNKLWPVWWWKLNKMKISTIKIRPNDNNILFTNWLQHFVSLLKMLQTITKWFGCQLKCRFNMFSFLWLPSIRSVFRILRQQCTSQTMPRLLFVISKHWSLFLLHIQLAQHILMIENGYFDECQMTLYYDNIIHSGDFFQKYLTQNPLISSWARIIEEQKIGSLSILSLP